MDCNEEDDGAEADKLVSSAYNLVNREEAFARSFTYIKNRTGPNTDPWGTPQVIGNTWDVTDPKLTNCLRFER